MLMAISLMRNECRSNLCCYLLMNPAIPIMPLWNSTSRNGNGKLHKIILILLAIIYKSGGGITPLNQKEWKEFLIGTLFSVKRPKVRSEKQYEYGKTPFVASGNVNNGVIKCCTPNENEKLDAGNCITVSPVDGSAFYQEYDFLGRGGAGSSILMLYNPDINKYSGLFISRMVRQTCSKYSYGKMGSQESIKSERIMLPVDESGNPDYTFMEQYVKWVKETIKLQYLQEKMAVIG